MNRCDTLSVVGLGGVTSGHLAGLIGKFEDTSAGTESPKRSQHTCPSCLTTETKMPECVYLKSFPVLPRQLTIKFEGENILNLQMETLSILPALMHE